MKKILKKMMILLDGRQKRKMVGLVFMMLIGALLETLGIAMIYPVIKVVMEENAVQNNEFLQIICKIFRIDPNNTTGLMVFIMMALV